MWFVELLKVAGLVGILALLWMIHQELFEISRDVNTVRHEIPTYLLSMSNTSAQSMATLKNIEGNTAPTINTPEAKPQAVAEPQPTPRRSRKKPVQ